MNANRFNNVYERVEEKAAGRDLFAEMFRQSLEGPSSAKKIPSSEVDPRGLSEVIPVSSGDLRGESWVIRRILDVRRY